MKDCLLAIFLHKPNFLHFNLFINRLNKLNVYKNNDSHHKYAYFMDKKPLMKVFQLLLNQKIFILVIFAREA